VNQIAENPQQFVDESHQLLAPLREAMSIGAIDPPEPNKEEVRKRAITLMLHILESIRTKIGELDQNFRRLSPGPIPDSMKEEASTLYRLADSACHQVYFASGAFDQRSSGRRSPAQDEVGAAQKIRFYAETKPVLHILGDLGIPAIIHRLLETLAFLLEANPKDVFLVIGEVVRSGSKRGYQHERMAADLMVQLIERYLAEYRQILREDRECRDVLREILDTFVQWPNARRLTCRLDEIFR
jgi:hypothetical protein